VQAGTSEVWCSYKRGSTDVAVEIVAGVSQSFASRYAALFPVPAAPMAGVGDIAFSFSDASVPGYSVGVVAAKGHAIVLVMVGGTTSTLAQVKSLVVLLLQ
jgi:hypothetical protein